VADESMFPQGSQERHNFINWMFRVIIGQYYRLTLEVSNVNNVKVVARGTGRVIFSVQILVKTDVLLYMQICTNSMSLQIVKPIKLQ